MSEPLSFRMTMDSNSKEIYRGSEFIGYIQKHPGRLPRLVLTCKPFTEITLNELGDIKAEFEA